MILSVSGFRSTSEFDAFGPWIDEVRTVDDLPRLYRDAGIEPAAHRLVLKVPRNIDRRDADPFMHLYDYLLAVDAETFTVLARRDDTYDTWRVPLDRVAAIRDTVRLLDGRLTVLTVDGGELTVAYNGSASGPIRELVRVLRHSYLPEAPPADPMPAAAAMPYLGREDTGLLTDYQRILAREPGLRLILVGARQVLTPIATAERLYRKIWPMTLHASIMVTDGREIQIVHRSTAITPNGEDLSLARTVLPRDRITGITVHPHERYWHVHVISVESGATRLEFPVTAGPITDAVLAGAAVPF